jgi:glutathione peroxidase
MTATPIQNIALQRIDGSQTTLVDYKGEVLLIVNVASKCGLTPQYEGLEKLYQRLHGKGLEVLGFPSNDFGAQEPGTEAEIQSFCNLNYGVSFPMFSKINTNSEPRHPLYAALIAAKPTATGSGDGKLQDTLAKHGLLPRHPTDVMWNFEKFLISRDGQVLGRFAPDVAPDAPALVTAIESALA